MPELAFVVPAYNEEALIGRCLESILREIETTDCRRKWSS